MGRKLEFTPINLPPFNSCRMCRNSMSQGCIEVCAPNRDYSYFGLKKNMTLEDMPRFPLDEWDDMPNKVRGKVVAAYLAKIFDYLRGVSDE